MRRSIVFTAILSTVFISAGAFAVNEIGMLTINDAVENNSRYFRNSGVKNAVTLSDIDASRFSGLSTGATVGDGRRDDDSTPMVIVYSVGIELNTIRITGAQFTSGVLNKTSGDANGVGFNLTLGGRQITDAEGSNLRNELTAVETDSGIECTLDFKAKHARLNFDVPIAAGTLSSVLTISVSAD